MRNFANAKARSSKLGRPETDREPNTDRQAPQFSFEFMARNSGHSVDCCDDSHRSALAAKMFKLTELTWNDIVSTHRHGLGSEKIRRSALNVEVPNSISEDATLIAIRYHGKHPMIGFRDGRVFNVVFIDHKLDVYDH